MFARTWILINEVNNKQVDKNLKSPSAPFIAQ